MKIQDKFAGSPWVSIATLKCSSITARDHQLCSFILSSENTLKGDIMIEMWISYICINLLAYDKWKMEKSNSLDKRKEKKKRVQFIEQKSLIRLRRSEIFVAVRNKSRKQLIRAIKYYKHINLVFFLPIPLHVAKKELFRSLSCIHSRKGYP